MTYGQCYMHQSSTFLLLVVPRQQRGRLGKSMNIRLSLVRFDPIGCGVLLVRVAGPIEAFFLDSLGGLTF